MAYVRDFSLEQLHSLFSPRSIALVGASDKSMWSRTIYNNLQSGNFGGQVFFVNPRAGTVLGQPVVARLADIGEPVDLVFIMVTAKFVLPVVHEMIEVGIRNAVVLASGFAEQDEQGRHLQQELTALAQEHQLAIIGPNCLGFINLTRHCAAMAGFFNILPLLAGSVAVISQSGATCTYLLDFAHLQHVGLSLLVSTGNEAMLTVTDVMEYAIEDEATRVIALFVESIRHPDQFIRTAQRALELGKPVVVLKTGRSELGARVAQAHTGALAGDDRVVDAVFRQCGVIRVDSLNDLICTAGVLARTGILPGNRFGFITVSGGICDLVADRAEELGIEFPAFAETTRAQLRTLVPGLTSIQNPLDTTAALANDLEIFGKAISMISQDPNLDALLCISDTPHDESQAQGVQGIMMASMARAFERVSCPAFGLANLGNDVSPVGKQVIERLHYPFLPGGVHLAMTAMGKAAWWSEQYRRYQRAHNLEGNNGGVSSALENEALPSHSSGAWSEWQVRSLLAQRGIPLIPATLATTAQQAAEAASTIGFPVALKIVSPDILHKSDMGGVSLNLQSEKEVRRACQHIMEVVQTVTTRIEGFLVSPMRSSGTELLVGVIRDPDWGQILAVGLGGIWVEVLRDTSLRMLPVTRGEVQTMLNELQGRALLQGARGSRPADMDALVDVILRVSLLAQALQDDLESLEINPLRVDGSRIEALDALITWRS